MKIELSDKAANLLWQYHSATRGPFRRRAIAGDLLDELERLVDAAEPEQAVEVNDPGTGTGDAPITGGDTGDDTSEDDGGGGSTILGL